MTAIDYVVLLIGCTSGLFLVAAVQGHSVGFFVGVNRIEWTPERDDDGLLDRWFCFWARIGMSRGAKRQ